MDSRYIFGLINSQVRSKVFSFLNEFAINVYCMYFKLDDKFRYFGSYMNQKLSIYCSKFSDFFYYNSLRFCRTNEGDYCFSF